MRTETLAPPGAADRSPRVRWLFRLIPKGERPDRPADYHIGEETRRLIAKIVYWLVRDHHELPHGEGCRSFLTTRITVGATASHPGRTSSSMMAVRPRMTRLACACASYCIGRSSTPATASRVAITPDLLRHVFATHAVQVEKVPLDVMGEMLKRKNLEVTDYYSQPTVSMVASAADMLLARFASHLDVGDAITRTPSEVRQLYEEARGKARARPPR